MDTQLSTPEKIIAFLQTTVQYGTQRDRLLDEHYEEYPLTNLTPLTAENALTRMLEEAKVIISLNKNNGKSTLIVDKATFILCFETIGNQFWIMPYGKTV